MSSNICKTCAYEAIHGVLDYKLSNVALGLIVGVSEKNIRNHRNNHQGVVPTAKMPLGESELHDDKGDHYTVPSLVSWGYDDFCEYIRVKGQDPDAVTFSWGVTSNPMGGYWNKINNVRPKTAANGGGPEWQPVDRAQPVYVAPMDIVSEVARDEEFKLGIKCADSQIGFRALPDGSYEEFHDAQAMDLFVAVCRLYQPDKITILGDFLDLAGQGRWVQEAGFALTTQMSFDAAHLFLAELRAACPDAVIEIIEGNHDKRMQSFIEANALSAYGLKRANLPEAWPVMSVPYLLRLDELDISYVDAYPAATSWDNDTVRNIHGTRSNSNGSTMAQYLGDIPNLSTWAGHTHRAEIVYKTHIGPRGNAIESYAANPGVLCRTDGTVPGVHGALHHDGSSAKVVEDWQQGIGFNYYNELVSIPQVYRIHNGRVMIDGNVISTDKL